jgi:hypothetical protein
MVDQLSKQSSFAKPFGKRGQHDPPNPLIQPSVRSRWLVLLLTAEANEVVHLSLHSPYSIPKETKTL